VWIGQVDAGVALQQQRGHPVQVAELLRFGQVAADVVNAAVRLELIDGGQRGAGGGAVGAAQDAWRRTG